MFSYSVEQQGRLNFVVDVWFYVFEVVYAYFVCKGMLTSEGEILRHLVGN